MQISGTGKDLWHCYTVGKKRALSSTRKKQLLLDRNQCHHMKLITSALWLALHTSVIWRKFAWRSWLFGSSEIGVYANELDSDNRQTFSYVLRTTLDLCLILSVYVNAVSRRKERHPTEKGVWDAVLNCGNVGFSLLEGSAASFCCKSELKAIRAFPHFRP